MTYLCKLCKLSSEDNTLFKSQHRCMVCHRKKNYESSKKYKAKNREKTNAYQKEYQREYYHFKSGVSQGEQKKMIREYAKLCSIEC